jgi:hypothetical protein
MGSISFLCDATLMIEIKASSARVTSRSTLPREWPFGRQRSAATWRLAAMRASSYIARGAGV